MARIAETRSSWFRFLFRGPHALRCTTTACHMVLLAKVGYCKLAPDSLPSDMPDANEA